MKKIIFTLFMILSSALGILCIDADNQTNVDAEVDNSTTETNETVTTPVPEQTTTVPGDIVLKENSRRWSDGTFSKNCSEYRYPINGKAYTGDTGNGLYRIQPSSTDPAFDAYCDMTTDGGGWTLVLLNSAYASPPKPTWNEAINSVSITGNINDSVDSFDMFVGLKFWKELGNRLRMDWGATSKLVVRRAYMNVSLDAENKYTIHLANLLISLGDKAPGLYEYHNGMPFTTYNIDNDSQNGTNCSTYYNNTAWWYGACWSGSFWGGGGGPSYQNKPYWWGSGDMYSEWGAFFLRPENTNASTKDGTSADKAAESCKAIFDSGFAKGNGDYWINPSSNTMGPFLAYCDMTTDGGGYTYKRFDDKINLGPVQEPYKSKCAAYGMGVIVPRSRANALAIRSWNGGAPPNLVGIYPKSNGNTGLNNWTGKCKNGDCTFWISDTNSSYCKWDEPSSNNDTPHMLIYSGHKDCPDWWATYWSAKENMLGDYNVVTSGWRNTGSSYQALLWKDGAATVLGTEISSAGSVYLDGNDIYAAGSEKKGSISVAKYWKNGTAIELTDGSKNASAVSIVVKNGTVYVSGVENNGTVAISKLWKITGNEITTVNLSDGSKNEYVGSIYIDGNSAYVAGYFYNGSKYTAKYWKDGSAVNITDGTQNAWAYSIAVYNNVVYTAGSENNGSKMVAKYWKNTIPTALTNGTQNADVLSMTVIDGNVYCAGYENNGNKDVAKYWKNTTATNLTNGIYNARASAIKAIKETTGEITVFTAGYEGGTSKFIAKYWKNKVSTSLSDGTTYDEKASGLDVQNKNIGWVICSTNDKDPASSIGANIASIQSGKEKFFTAIVITAFIFATFTIATIFIYRRKKNP